MEIVGLAEKNKIKFVVDIWGPDHPSGASIDSIPFHSTALHSIDPFHSFAKMGRAIFRVQKWGGAKTKTKTKQNPEAIPKAIPKAN